jgi:hypothetical protein
MPLEIKELHIKVSVSPPEGGVVASNGAPPPGNGPGNGQANQDEIVAAVVEQVLQILQEKKEA